MDIAIIPARGGSKRIPRKNIKLFHGEPIISYSIIAALNSKLFDKVIVSTDDNEIAEVSLKYGAEVPFIRPAEISDDYATTNDVISHAVNWYLDRRVDILKVCCIYATAPFLTVDNLLQARDMLVDDVDFVFSATEFAYPIFRAFKLKKDNYVKMFWPSNYNKRSQDLEKAYHDAGMFYYGKAQSFLDGNMIFSERSKALVISNNFVQDIDEMSDWNTAELKYKLMKFYKCDNLL